MPVSPLGPPGGLMSFARRSLEERPAARPAKSRRTSRARVRTRGSRGSIGRSRKLRWGLLFSMPVSPLGSPGGLMFSGSRFARMRDANVGSQRKNFVRPPRGAGFEGRSSKAVLGTNSRSRQPAGSPRRADCFSRNLARTRFGRDRLSAARHATRKVALGIRYFSGRRFDRFAGRVCALFPACSRAGSRTGSRHGCRARCASTASAATAFPAAE
jgi:hypothetical protein